MFKLLGVADTVRNASSCALQSNYIWKTEAFTALINTGKVVFYHCSSQAKKKNAGRQGVRDMIPFKLEQTNINLLFLCIVNCRVVQ